MSYVSVQSVSPHRRYRSLPAYTPAGPSASHISRTTWLFASFPTPLRARFHRRSGVTGRLRIGSLGALALALLVFVWGVVAPSAYADRPFTPRLQVSASTYAAAAHPRLTVTVSKANDGLHWDPATGLPSSFYNEQDLKDFRVALPEGLIVNPRSIAYCGLRSGGDGDSCTNPDAQVGVGQLGVEVWVLMPLPPPLPPLSIPTETLTMNARVYNEAPHAGEQARTAIIVEGGRFTVFRDIPFLKREISVPGFALSSASTLDSRTLAPVLEAKSLPNSVSYQGQTFPLSVSRISLSLDGEKGSDRGYPLISNPTSCERHTVDGAFTSYGDDDRASGDDFTLTHNVDYPVTDCDGLPYSPQLDLSVNPLTAGAKPSVRQVITQQPGEAANGSVTFSMPSAFKPNPSRNAQICSDAQIAAASCPPGSKLSDVSLQTPLLAAPLKGSSYMGPPVGDRVRVVTFLDGPVRTRMEGTLWQRPDRGVDTITENMPDLPVERIEYTSVGGDQASFLNPLRCGPQTVTAAFRSRSGKSVTINRNVQIDGCVGASGTRTRKLEAKVSPSKPRKAANLHLKLTQDPGAKLKSIEFTVGKGLRWRFGKQSRKFPLGSVSRVADDGVIRERSLYLVSARRHAISFKVKDKDAPMTLRLLRRGKQVRLQLGGLPPRDLSDIELELLGRHGGLLKTPARCARSRVDAVVVEANGASEKLSAQVTPGCPKSL